MGKCISTSRSTSGHACLFQWRPSAKEQWLERVLSRWYKAGWTESVARCLVLLLGRFAFRDLFYLSSKLFQSA